MSLRKQLLPRHGADKPGFHRDLGGAADKRLVPLGAQVHRLQPSSGKAISAQRRNESALASAAISTFALIGRLGATAEEGSPLIAPAIRVAHQQD
jgi:hypothetical protein